MKFSVSGTIKLKNGARAFTKKVEAKSRNDAIQRVYGIFGSANGLKRNFVEIKEVKEAA